MGTAVVVVTYNRCADTIRALENVDSLPDRPESIVVVDNGSAQDEAAAIAALNIPGLSTIRLEKNIGYARACNLALRRVLEGPARYVFLLNNDAMVDAGCIERLRAALDEGSYGAACPLIVDLHDTGTINSAGGYCVPARGTVGNRLKGHRREEAMRRTPVSFAPGTALLVKREALEEAGLIPERWFLYFEDVELSLNLIAHGRPIVYVPDAVVRHAEGSTMRQTGENYFYYWRNYLLFLEEYARGWPRLARTARTLGIMALIAGKNLVVYHRPWHARVLLNAAWAGLSGNWAARMPAAVEGAKTP